MTKTWEKEEKVYALMQNGAMTLNIDAVIELGWTTDTILYQFVDRKRKLLYVIDNEQNIAKLPTDQCVHANPIVGQKYQIAENKATQISAQAKRALGWEIGGRFKQTLDMKIRGIIIEKVEESNG